MTALRPSFPTQRIAQEIITGPDDVVFVSGSIVEGFGNENSDLDLFLVRHDGDATPDPRLVLATVGVDGSYVDYEVYNQANMAAVARSISDTDVADFRAVWELPLERIDLYYRTAVAEPAYNPEGLARLQHSFDRATVTRLLQAWTGLRSRIKLLEAREALDRAYAPQALVAAQAAAAYACDSYLASQGEAYPNLKWRYEKIARRFGRDCELFRRMWSLKSPGSRGVPAYLDEVASFCHDLGMDAYAGWDIDCLFLRRSREARLFRIGQRYVLIQNKAMSFELNTRAAQAWRALQRPMTRPQLSERMAGLWKAGLSQAEREVDDLLRHLKRYRLVREG